jgi:hypothetical protein
MPDDLARLERRFEDLAGPGSGPDTSNGRDRAVGIEHQADRGP